MVAAYTAKKKKYIVSEDADMYAGEYAWYFASSSQPRESRMRDTLYEVALFVYSVLVLMGRYAVYRALVYHRPKTMNIAATVPTNLFVSAVNGITSGSLLPPRVMMFQSKVGSGFSPTPFAKPVTADRFTLFGAIQVIQLKALSAVKM